MTKIIFIQTEDNNIITNVTEKDIQARDQAVREKDIMNLVEMELDENLHNGYLDDYECELDFFLSNAIKDSYREYIPHILDNLNLNQEALELVQEKVIEKIEKKVIGMTKFKKEFEELYRETMITLEYVEHELHKEVVNKNKLARKYTLGFKQALIDLIEDVEFMETEMQVDYETRPDLLKDNALFRFNEVADNIEHVDYKRGYQECIAAYREQINKILNK